MSLGQEAVRSLGSAFKILKYAPDAFDGFNLSLDGFWRSFAAVFIVLPMSWMMADASRRASLDSTGAGDQPLGIAYNTAAVLLFFGLWPAMVAGLCRLFGLGQHYVRYIIAYNWLSVPLTLLAVIPDALYLSGAVGAPLWRIAGFAAMMIALYYSWYLARAALETTASIAVAFVLADFSTSALLFYALPP